MLAATLCFAAMDAATKWVVHSLPIVEVMMMRGAVFLLFAVVLIKPARLPTALRTRRPLLQAGRALLLFVESGTFVLSFSVLPLADVHAIAAASPLIVMALSAPMLGERVDAARWLAVGAGCLGVLVILRPGFAELRPILALPLFGAVLWGLYQLLVRLSAREDGSETTMIWNAWVGFAAAVTVGVWDFVMPTPLEWLLLAIIASLGSFAQYAFIRSFAAAEAGALQPFTYTLFLWAIVFGFTVFGDVPDVFTLVGGAIVVASGIFAWQRERSAARV